MGLHMSSTVSHVLNIQSALLPPLFPCSLHSLQHLSLSHLSLRSTSLASAFVSAVSLCTCLSSLALPSFHVNEVGCTHTRPVHSRTPVNSRHACMGALHLTLHMVSHLRGQSVWSGDNGTGWADAIRNWKRQNHSTFVLDSLVPVPTGSGVNCLSSFCCPRWLPHDSPPYRQVIHGIQPSILSTGASHFMS